jgi:hypothetical protein
MKRWNEVNREELKKEVAERCEALRNLAHKMLAGPEYAEYVIGHGLLHDEPIQVTVHQQTNLGDFFDLGVDETPLPRRLIVHVTVHTPYLLSKRIGEVFHQMNYRIKRALE